MSVGACGKEKRKLTTKGSDIFWGGRGMILKGTEHFLALPFIVFRAISLLNKCNFPLAVRELLFFFSFCARTGRC